MPRALVRNLFLRILGLIFLAAFLSLWVQVEVLIGSDGLLPLRLDGVSDAALEAGALLGALLSLGLVFDLAPRWCLLASWLLYLATVHAGRDFFAFQWDNLLLESAFFALFVTPGGWRARDAPSPHPLGVFLMLWLVFRLHFESGAAKLLSGDPTWRDLTAMVAYYETAPLPTWLAWYAHQMPLWAHRLTALATLVVELGLPFLLWAPHRLRGAVFALLVATQLGIVLTANYAFFNYLAIALCLFVLDDDHLRWLLRRPRPAEPLLTPAALSGGAAGIAALVALLTLVPFAPWLPLPAPVEEALRPLARVLAQTRSINAYHLFASMTLVRREAVIEGSEDGEHWREYELRYQPGDPARAPRFAAPHQPRVDFQNWFLLLRGGAVPPYFENLLRGILAGSPAVTALFAHDPFPARPPRFVRVAVYRYRFTRATGGPWWQRELLGHSRVWGGG